MCQYRAHILVKRGTRSLTAAKREMGGKGKRAREGSAWRRNRCTATPIKVMDDNVFSLSNGEERVCVFF